MTAVFKRARRAVRRRAYWLYLLSQMRRLWRMRRDAAEARARGGLTLVSRTPAFDRRSDTVFVLGSGASINDLGPAFWDHVADCDSIGFNNWLVHDFVPNFYMRETAFDPVANEVFISLLRQRRDTFGALPFILRRGFTNRRAAIWPEVSARLREHITGPVCLPDVLNIPAETETEMRSFCRVFRRLGLHRDRDLHLDCRASLSQLIYFGLVQGYSDIVLCGIDLNTKIYFWEDPRWTGPRVDLPSNNSNNAQHRTMDPSLGLPIDRIVAVMRDELLSPAGVRLHVARPNSALASFLPVYHLP